MHFEPYCLDLLFYHINMSILLNKMIPIIQYQQLQILQHFQILIQRYFWRFHGICVYYQPQLL